MIVDQKLFGQTVQVQYRTAQLEVSSLTCRIQAPTAVQRAVGFEAVLLLPEEPVKHLGLKAEQIVWCVPLPSARDRTPYIPPPLANFPDSDPPIRG